jgi:hypothetical protein
LATFSHLFSSSENIGDTLIWTWANALLNKFLNGRQQTRKTLFTNYSYTVYVFFCPITSVHELVDFSNSGKCWRHDLIRLCYTIIYNYIIFLAGVEAASKCINFSILDYHSISHRKGARAGAASRWCGSSELLYSRLHGQQTTWKGPPKALDLQNCMQNVKIVWHLWNVLRVCWHNLFLHLQIMHNQQAFYKISPRKKELCL